MAKIVTDHIVISVSKIARNDEPAEQTLVSDEIRGTIEQVVAELLGEDFVVEMGDIA